ncbi:MAG TPA: GNAT family N-acetyltransferase [Bacteriovoracaceae bacterium]|nr:GNAT family N-acetyltransferase [Bacteriovoracaceae bacterium]
MDQLFFTKTFYSTFQWRDSTYYLGAILPDYQKDLLEGINHLSPHSIRNRFLGGKKTLTEKELHYLTHFDGINHFALGVRNSEQRGIAVTRMVRSNDNANLAEIAITIIDEYQNLGLGTLLFKVIAYAAYERGINELIIHLLQQNEGMQKLARKVGRLISKIFHGETVTYTIKLEETEMNKIKSELEELFIEIKKAQ